MCELTKPLPFFAVTGLPLPDDLADALKVVADHFVQAHTYSGPFSGQLSVSCNFDTTVVADAKGVLHTTLTSGVWFR